MTTTPNPSGSGVADAACQFIAAARDFANAGPDKFQPGYAQYVDLLEEAEKLALAHTEPRGPEVSREAVARLLCAQHGGDPDAIAIDEHDCWDGPLWTVFLKDADAILALTPSTKIGEGELLAWFTSQTRLSLGHHSPVYGDDDDQSVEWRVTRESGSINDREVDVIGRGATVADAIHSARLTATAAPPLGQDIGSQAGEVERG